MSQKHIGIGVSIAGTIIAACFMALAINTYIYDYHLKLRFKSYQSEQPKRDSFFKFHMPK
jgi:hypothetical protein